MDSLWSQSFSLLPQLLTAAECRDIRALYAEPAHFRSRIDMKRYRFGQGEYQYFAYPLPERVAELRSSLYRQLAPVAREWMATLKLPTEFPDDHERFQETCHAAGQLRPTPLLLKYAAGNFNCLHQDLYGAIFFPFLSRWSFV